MNDSFNQLDAWVLTTYQRLERLKVHAFGPREQPLPDTVEGSVAGAQLRLLPTDLPREIASFASWAGGASQLGVPEHDDWKHLSLLLKYLAAPLHYEPGAVNPIHKAVPSSRARFPLQFFLLEQRCEVLHSWLYVPQFHALHELPLPGLDAALAPGELGIACVGRVWAYAREYGEFSSIPCVLEAGHAFATFSHLAGLLSLGAGRQLDRLGVQALCRHPLESVMFAAVLPAKLDCERLPTQQVRLQQTAPRADLVSQFPRLKAVQAMFDGGGALPVRPAAAQAGLGPPAHVASWPDVGALGTMRRRNSGNMGQGISAMLSAPPPGLFDSLLTSWHALRAQRTTLGPESTLNCALAWVAPHSQTPVGLYGQDGRASDTGWTPGQFMARLGAMQPPPRGLVNLSSLVAILVIQCDPPIAIERFGAAALREVHMAAGAVAQDFCFAAAAHGMFARPVRMMLEARLEMALPLTGQVIYVVLCGFARRSNLTMELW